MRRTDTASLPANGAMVQPAELGRLISSHTPIRPALALAVCSAPGLAIGAGLAFGAVGSPVIGAYVFVLTTLLLIGLFADSLFVRQQVYEHGLLLDSSVPLTPRYAVPYATIAPESVTVEPYRRVRGAADVTDTFARRYRQAPMVEVVSFVGPAPAVARRLARRRADWRSTIASMTALPIDVRPRAADSERWYVSFRDAVTVANDLRARAQAGGRP